MYVTIANTRLSAVIIVIIYIIILSKAVIYSWRTMNLQYDMILASYWPNIKSFEAQYIIVDIHPMARLKTLPYSYRCLVCDITRHLVSHCNVSINFEFSDKSLDTKNNSNRRRSISL